MRTYINGATANGWTDQPSDITDHTPELMAMFPDVSRPYISGYLEYKTVLDLLPFCLGSGVPFRVVFPEYNADGSDHEEYSVAIPLPQDGDDPNGWRVFAQAKTSGTQFQYATYEHILWGHDTSQSAELGYIQFENHDGAEFPNVASRAFNRFAKVGDWLGEFDHTVWHYDKSTGEIVSTGQATNRFKLIDHVIGGTVDGHYIGEYVIIQAYDMDGNEGEKWHLSKRHGNFKWTWEAQDQGNLFGGEMGDPPEIIYPPTLQGVV